MRESSLTATCFGNIEALVAVPWGQSRSRRLGEAWCFDAEDRARVAPGHSTAHVAGGALRSVMREAGGVARVNGRAHLSSSNNAGQRCPTAR